MAKAASHEVWAWMMPDDDGDLCVAYVETAGGTKVPMIAMTEVGAKGLRVIVERMVQVLERPWTLVHFSGGEELETLEPK